MNNIFHDFSKLQAKYSTDVKESKTLGNKQLTMKLIYSNRLNADTESHNTHQHNLDLSKTPIQYSVQIISLIKSLLFTQTQNLFGIMIVLSPFNIIHSLYLPFPTHHFQNFHNLNTVEPCYKQDLGTIKIILCQVSSYIRVKDKEI